MRASWPQRIKAVLKASSFSIVYQPIVNLWSLTPIGYEALARFPDGTPEDYFHHAYEYGLHEALEAATATKAHELFFHGPRRMHGYLSLNLCNLCIAKPHLLPRRHAHRVQLEITEHRPISDYHAINACMNELRRHGMTLAIDDVGAGYAAMRHLIMLSPDVIKLDRTLIQGIHSVEAVNQRALLVAIATYAARAHIEVVAEGIETAEEVVALRTLGVQHGQGFHLGRPDRIENVP